MGQVNIRDLIVASESNVHQIGAWESTHAPSHDMLPVSNDREIAARVLLAEDDDALRALMRAFLESEGYHVIVCRDGLRALEAFQKIQHIDLLISDLQMPGMTGDHLATIISGMRPMSPIILVSGSELSQDLRSLVREKGWIFLAKPFQFTEMLSAIHDITDTTNRPLSVAPSFV